MEKGVNQNQQDDAHSHTIKFLCKYPNLSVLILSQIILGKQTNSVKIKKLERQLRHIKAYFDGRESDNSNPGSNWNATIRKVAFDIEDLIELYHLGSEQLPFTMKQLTPFSIGKIERLTKLFVFSLSGRASVETLDRKTVKILDYITSQNEIKNYQRRAAAALAGDYIPVRVAVAGDYNPARVSTPCGKEKVLVGLEADTAALISELIGGENHTSLRSVSIVGIGGMGKTSLAGKVYTDPKITERFGCLMWISVSQHFNSQDVLISILQTILQGLQISRPLGELHDSELKAMVHEILDGKKYLAVLDDVWTQEAWDHVISAFPKTNNMGSRLIVTTRNHQLQTGTPGIRHLMKPLNEQESRELFCHKASIEGNSTEFDCIQAKLLTKCAGLPLAIIVVARELYRERRKERWDSIYQELSTLQGSLVQDITNALDLSYNNLSLDLRSCFLRIGFFPENEEISSKQLLYIWEAEGLLSNCNHDSRETESLGKNNLDALIKCGLIQPAHVGLDDRTSVKRCKIHPLMHVLAASKAREEIYFQTNTSSEIRHGAIFASTTSFAHLNKAPHLRSLFTFQPGGSFSSKLLKSICWHSKLLKVLYLKGMNIRKLPDNIGYLSNLRYLNLCETGIRFLPQSVGYLVHLLFLDVRKNPGLKGISVVKKLKNLRILLLDDSLEPFKIGSLNQLRMLKWVRLEHLKTNDIVNKANMEVMKVIITDSRKSEEFFKALFRSDHLPSATTRFGGKLKKLHLKVRMSESEWPSNIARGFHLLLDEMEMLRDYSIATLHSRCIEERALVVSGDEVKPHIYIEYLQ